MKHRNIKLAEMFQYGVKLKQDTQNKINSHGSQASTIHATIYFVFKEDKTSINIIFNI